MNSASGVRSGMFRATLAVACAGLGLSLMGCATPRAVIKDPQPSVTVARGPAPAPKADVTRNRQNAASPFPDSPVELLEGEKQSPGEFRKPEPRSSMVLASAESREVFLSLAKENDFSLVLSPDVSGTVTMDVKEAGAPEVMKEVCGLLSCRLEFSGKTARVLPANRITRIFPLDCLLTTRTGSGSITASSSTSGSTSGFSSWGGESRSLNSVGTEEKFDFWSGIVEEVHSMLSEGGKVVPNRASGTLAVTDFPARVEQVGEYLATLDLRSRIGVMNETRILEVALDDTTQYGIDWTALHALSSLSLSASLAGGAAVRQRLRNGTDAFQIGATGSKFDAFLDALSTQGQVKVLSAPKVSTLNNQRAIIRIGRQDVFFRGTVTPASETTAAFVTFSPDSITEGIIMNVPPQIGKD